MNAALAEAVKAAWPNGKEIDLFQLFAPSHAVRSKFDSELSEEAQQQEFATRGGGQLAE